jgi:hypothetical protein
MVIIAPATRIDMDDRWIAVDALVVERRPGRYKP